MERPDSGSVCVLTSPSCPAPRRGDHVQSHGLSALSTQPTPTHTDLSPPHCLLTSRLTRPRPLNPSTRVSSRHLKPNVPRTALRTFPHAGTALPSVLLATGDGSSTRPVV